LPRLARIDCIAKKYSCHGRESEGPTNLASFRGQDKWDSAAQIAARKIPVKRADRN
jgi:hypothetical protein